MKIFDPVSIIQTACSGLLKFTRNSVPFQVAEMTQDTGYITPKKKRSTHDSFLTTITVHSESCLVMYIFSQFIRTVAVLTYKKNIKTICLCHRVFP